jgi:hypothetical protein
MKMFELLDSLRRYPEFSNAKSLKGLRSFLFGYESATGEYRIKDAAAFSDLRPFSDWIARRYGYQRAAARSWYSMIMERTESDEKAFDVFFELLDQYRSEMNRTRQP